MKTPKNLRPTDASVFIGALFIITVLMTLGASAMFYASNRRLTMGQTANWQEALVLAEDGYHSAAAQITSGSGVSLTSGTYLSSGTYALALSHKGDGVTSGSAQVAIIRQDARGGLPYYKIRSVGTIQIPGSKSLSNDSADSVLRKLNLGTSTRTASRAVEVWVSPILTTDAAIATVSSIDLNNHQLTIDAYNSTDPTRYSGTNQYGVGLSGTTGQFTASMNPPIYDATLATSGSVMDLSNATVYGDALTGGGISATNSSNVMGMTRTDYSGSFPNMTVPSYLLTASGLKSTTQSQGNGSKAVYLTNVTAADSFQASPSNPVVYARIDTINLSGGKGISFNLSGGLTSGTFEVYVDGIQNNGKLGTAIDTTGGGSITISPGVHVTFYVAGDIKLTGNSGTNSFTNSTQSALALTIYGVGTNQTFDFGGTSSFFGSVYAPGAAFKLGGDATFTGNVTAYSANLGGNASFMYDAALANQGKVTGFKPLGWFEDTGSRHNQL